MNSVYSCAVVYTKGESDVNSGPHEPSGFPGGPAGKKSACNAGDLGLIWVGKIPWRKERLPSPVFWPGEFHGLCSP